MFFSLLYRISKIEKKSTKAIKETEFSGIWCPNVNPALLRHFAVAASSGE